MASAWIAYLHYVAMTSIAVVLAVEYTICVPGIGDRRIQAMARLDFIYMCAALVALGSGVARVIWFGRGPGFYLHNPVFYLKLALFVAVGLISIPPTLQYLRWMHALKTGAANVAADYQVWRVRKYVLAQLILFAFIPLMATFMARGIGIQTTPP